MKHFAAGLVVVSLAALTGCNSSPPGGNTTRSTASHAGGTTTTTQLPTAMTPGLLNYAAAPAGA